MDKNQDLTKTFFDQHAGHYSEFSSSGHMREIREKIKFSVDRELSGEAIDIGSAGEIYYETNKTDTFVSLDTVYQLLKNLPEKKAVYPVCGDAERLPFKENVFNVAICRWLIHHLVRNSIKASNELIEKTLAEIYRILDHQGKIVIVENCLFRCLERIENLVFKVFLRLAGKPPVRFLSVPTLGELLKRSGFVETRVIRVNWKRTWKLVPVGVLLPSFKIPDRFIPTTVDILIARKP